MADKIELTFTKEKVTKGTWRYKEDGDSLHQVIGALYIRKHHLQDIGEAEKIRITIEPAD